MNKIIEIPKDHEAKICGNKIIIEPTIVDGEIYLSEYGTPFIAGIRNENERPFVRAWLNLYGNINYQASYAGVSEKASEEECRRIFDALAKDGKRWNPDKKCIENIAP